MISGLILYYFWSTTVTMAALALLDREPIGTVGLINSVILGWAIVPVLVLFAPFILFKYFENDIKVWQSKKNNF